MSLLHACGDRAGVSEAYSDRFAALLVHHEARLQGGLVAP